jgi:hypothetical protein
LGNSLVNVSVTQAARDCKGFAMSTKNIHSNKDFLNTKLKIDDVDVPISTPVTTASGYIGTLADILRDTIMNFHWGQELECIITK